jgi:hypothetical protein
VSTFGPIVDGGMVERAVLSSIKTWLPTYVVEVERQAGRTPGDLPAPRDWRIVNELEAPVGPKQFPAVWLVSAGLDGEPDQHEESFTAAWLVTVAVIVSARDHERTVANARIYTAAIRAALVQQQCEEDFVLGVEWVDETYDRGPTVLENTTAYGTLTFRVHVGGALTRYGGPHVPLSTPLPDPVPDPPDAPSVETVQITTTPTGAP